MTYRLRCLGRLNRMRRVVERTELEHPFFNCRLHATAGAWEAWAKTFYAFVISSRMRFELMPGRMKALWVMPRKFTSTRDACEGTSVRMVDVPCDRCEVVGPHEFGACSSYRSDWLYQPVKPLWDIEIVEGAVK